jgi:hypothetical protein
MRGHSRVHFSTLNFQIQNNQLLILSTRNFPLTMLFLPLLDLANPGLRNPTTQEAVSLNHLAPSCVSLCVRRHIKRDSLRDCRLLQS